MQISRKDVFDRGQQMVAVRGLAYVPAKPRPQTRRDFIRHCVRRERHNGPVVGFRFNRAMAPNPSSPGICAGSCEKLP